MFLELVPYLFLCGFLRMILSVTRKKSAGILCVWQGFLIAASGEICRKDVRKKMRNRLLVFVFCNDLHGDILSGASGVHGVFFNVAMRRFLGHLLFDNEQTFGT